MPPTVDTVSLILLRGGKVLAEKRSVQKTTFPGAVCIPGGHVDPGETAEEACRRELREELNLECSHLILYAEMLCEAGVEMQQNKWFICEGWRGEPESREAEELLWIGKDRASLLSVENDRLVIQRLLRERE